MTECANKKRKKERKSRWTGKREKKNHETETALFGCGSDEADHDVTEDLFCFKNSGIPRKIFFFYDEEPQQYRYIDLGIFIVTITVNCT